MTEQEQKLEKAIAALFERERLYEEYRETEAIAIHAYKLGFAMAFAKADGAMDLRKEDAVIACGDLLKEMEVAKAKADIAREKLRDAVQVLSVRQSLFSANARSGDWYGRTQQT